MSAIFGLLFHDGEPVSRQLLEPVAAALAGLGPQDGGFWVDGSVGLGNRLMHITLEDAFEQQPLVCTESQRVLVFDGRLDNRPELCASLAIPPHEADRLPDSAFVMRAWAQWGDDCPRRLLGNFTFAMWDGRVRALSLVCAPQARSCIFYHQTPRLFAFATMPRGLFALPFIPRALDESKIAEHLVALVNAESSLYRNVFKVPSGHVLSVRRGEVAIRRWWSVDDVRPIRFRRDEQYVEAWQELWERVMRDNLRATTPLAVMLSGGLDSSSVAATAAPLLGGQKLLAYTEVPRKGFNGTSPEGRYADETELVTAIARQYENLETHFVQTDGRMFLDVATSFFEHLEAPFLNSANLVWMDAIGGMARDEGARAVLTGVPGNVTMSWDGAGLLAECLQQGRWGHALREARGMVAQKHSRSILRALVRHGLLPLFSYPLSSMQWHLRWIWPTRPRWHERAPIHPAFAKAHDIDGTAQRYAQTPLHFIDTRRARRKFMEWSNGFAYYDAAFRSRAGVELRNPCADVRVIEFCLALPEDQCRRNGESRWLTRRAMAGRLPPEVLNNRRRGLQAADAIERLGAARERISAELAALQHSDLARRALNLERMSRIAAHGSTSGSAPEIWTDSLYLSQGLMMGNFLRWFETGVSIR